MLDQRSNLYQTLRQQLQKDDVTQKLINVTTIQPEVGCLAGCLVACLLALLLGWSVACLLMNSMGTNV